jgi:exopolyphosphatase
MSPPKNAFTPLYVPITNIPAVDIQLRPEYLAVFRHADIEPGHLITLDDLPPLSDIQTKLVPENTQWVLVDHNALQGRLGKIYSERVAGVIDHHDDEGKVRKDTGDEPRIIEKSGSCTSLIANYCRPTWDFRRQPCHLAQPMLRATACLTMLLLSSAGMQVSRN